MDKKILAVIDEQNARIYTIDVDTGGIHATNITISGQPTALVSIPNSECTKLLWTDDSLWPIREADFNGANRNWITTNGMQLFYF